MTRTYFVYMMTNYTNSTIYTGVTNNLERRVYEHQCKANPRYFTAKYKCTKLVYFSDTNDINTAIYTEKQIKAGSRKNKEKLIKEINPQWKDLSAGWF